MRIRWKSLLVVGAVVVIANALVMAQSPKGAPDMGVGPKVPGYPEGLISVLAWWLDLTKEQVGQMHAILEQMRPDAKEAAALATAFKTADTNKDGVLSLAEFLAALADTKDGAPPTQEGDKAPAGGDQPVEK